MVNTKEIVSDMESINQVLLDNDIYYYIPDFQRSFVWGKDEVTQLFDDLKEDTNNFQEDTSSLEGYLFGNIVLLDSSDGTNKKRMIVVDGQQRLTTFSLISKALSNVVLEIIRRDPQKMVTWFQRMGELHKAYKVVDDNDNLVHLKIEHDPSLKFGAYYKELILHDKIDEDSITTEEDANIRDVYLTAYDIINELSEIQLQKFITYFKNKIKIIVTSAPTESKAFQLFETLNDRGRSLEPMDLVKNSFLKVLNQEKRSQFDLQNFNDNWSGLINNLQINKNKKISSSTFLKQFILSYKGDNVRADKLFDYLKTQYFTKGGKNGNEILQFVEKMKNTSAVYREIEKGNYDAYLKDYNMFILFKLLNIKQLHPILMIFYNSGDSEKALVLDVVTRLGASVLFSFTQTNYIEKIMPAIIKEYHKEKHENPQQAFDNFLNRLEERIVECAENVKNVIQNRNFVGARGNLHGKALIILKFIELYFNKNTIIISKPKGKKITAEHILSQKLDETKVSFREHNFVDEKERDDYIHKLGNITLLFNTDNSSVGNKIFNDKKACYKASSFILTSTIIEKVSTTVKRGMDATICQNINTYEKQYALDEKLWTKDMIEQRSKDLSNLLYDILTKKV